MTRHISAAATLLLLASCDGSTEINSSRPPAQFQGDGVTLVVFASDVEGACHAAGLRAIEGTRVTGCAVLNGPEPRIILANPCLTRGTAYARAACHELGHANGWPADHGN